MQYTHETNGEVLVHYLYDGITDNLYEWAVNGKPISPYTKDFIKDWVSRQEQGYIDFVNKLAQEDEGFIAEELTYDDILEYLADYIRQKAQAGELHAWDEWRKSIFSMDLLRNGDQDIVQITVENTRGSIDMPDMEFKKVPTDGILMKIGGNVFYDETETKDGKVSNGYMDKGEMPLSGVEVTLIEKETGNKATLVSAKDEYGEETREIRTNPTITDDNGYYEFRGVDPLKTYYVKFTYNGMEYTPTMSPSEPKYNSDEWATSSKGSELQGDRDGLNAKFSTVTANPDIKPYNYDVLEGLYKEIEYRTLKHIQGTGEYPDLETIYNEVKAKHSSDKEIEKKIAYIKAARIDAWAGYTSETGKNSLNDVGAYPYYATQDGNGRTMKNTSAMNTWKWGQQGEDEINYAQDVVKVAYPGQLQIHLGLVERDSINLSLTTDIVQTTVSTNNYDTEYKYHKGLSSYKQYMYEEDYNYSVIDENGNQHKRFDPEAKTENGVAYYTDDGIDFYMTYEVRVKNETENPALAHEIVDYYDKNFTHAVELEGAVKEYQTTKIEKWENGTPVYRKIPAYKVLLNEKDITNEVEISRTSENTSEEYAKSVASGDYKSLFIKFKNADRYINYGDDLRIQLTFKMNEGTAKDVAENLNNHLYTADKTSRKSKSWLIHNYAEINAYRTQEGLLDYNSRPGNLDINEYVAKRTKYQEAYDDYVMNPAQSKEERALQERKVKLALARLNAVREDDAWTVAMTLTNSGYKRELTGNVWEAIPDNEDFKNALGLNKAYGADDYLNHTSGEDGKLNLEGIKVELVELEKDGKQTVRGKTTTASDGSYKFTSYIAGDYTIRFIYGDYESEVEYSAENKDGVNGVIRSKVSTYADGTLMPVNGQYYQSTKANPNTDTHKYWYKEKDYNDKEVEFDSKQLKSQKSDEEFLTRYSDAYDDAYSRLTQMQSEVYTDHSEFYNNSIEYDYEGIREVETTRHTDPIYAYTSTMELEIEYTRPEVTGNAKNKWYEYKINNVDFGVTPRAKNDVNIDKYVSNIKVYLQNRSKLIDVSFNQDGSFRDTPETTGKEHFALDNGEPNVAFQDGYIRFNYNELLLQRANVEVTYTFVVSNDSEHDGEIYDTIKYITSGGKKIAVVYYDEDTEKLTAYETVDETGKIVYHNAQDSEEHGEMNLRDTEGVMGANDRVNNKTERLQKFAKIDGYNVENAQIITSRATQIVDYPNAPFEFKYENFEGGQINVDNWVTIENKDFVTSREKYTTKDLEINGEKVDTDTKLLDTRYKLVATDSNQLYNVLKPGESVQEDLVLTAVLGSTIEEVTTDSTQDLTNSDYELSNLVEITRVASSAGKMTELEGYDLNGLVEPETSKIHKPEELDNKDDKPPFVPTISTSKTKTIVIATPTGLNFIESNIGANLIIVLIGLVVLATGLVLIKKFVLVKKSE